ncbi:MAG: kynureninase [Pseudomonadota bacterium]
MPSLPLPSPDLFDLPEGVIYLDGNSLGPLPKVAAARIHQTTHDEWGQMLIRGWNNAGWIDLPNRVGDRIARLIGAPEGSVLAVDSTSVNLFKVLSAALALRPERREVVSETGNFPTDLYMAQGLLAAQGGPSRLVTVEAADLISSITSDTAVVMLTHVNYRTGAMHDMDAITAAAHAAGALVIWDLAHSAGALPVDLTAAGADFAVGCGYKYLNGGPGAPAFVYVRPDLQEEVRPVLAGWLGHAAPFDFSPDYAPAPGIQRMQAGTPPILSLSALDAALEIWEDVDMDALRARSIALCDLFIAEVEVRCAGHGLELVSPRDGTIRGSQVSFRCPEGYAVMQALIAGGVIGDFRAPDLIRFGFAPLYNSDADVIKAAIRLGEILTSHAWDRPEFLARAKVT